MCHPAYSNVKLCDDEYFSMDELLENCIKEALENNQTEFLCNSAYILTFNLENYIKMCIKYAFEYDNVKVLHYFAVAYPKDVIKCFLEAKSCSINCLDMMYTYHKFTEQMRNKILMNNDKTVIDYMLNNYDKKVWPIDTAFIIKLIDEDNMITISSLLERYVATPGICYIATRNVKYLKYFHEQGYKIYSYTCISAIKNGNLDSLKYLLENGCSLNNTLFDINKINRYMYMAISNKQYEIAEYMLENGVAMHENILYEDLENYDIQTIDYLYNHNIKFLEIDHHILSIINSEIFEHLLKIDPSLKNEKLIKILANEKYRHVWKYVDYVPPVSKKKWIFW
jgi:hypothetical protein